VPAADHRPELGPHAATRTQPTVIESSGPRDAAACDTELDSCSAFMFGSHAGDAESGYEPGGGGAGDWTCQFAWMSGGGWGMGGEGGHGSRGATSSLAGGMGGRNSGYYTGGDGGRGEVRIAWTCE
jgi:hypothetical protein